MPPPNIDDDSKYDALHVRAPDDSEYIMNGVYKDMAIATFKRTIAIKGKIRSWEGIELYYMGVEMQNSMSFCGDILLSTDRKIPQVVHWTLTTCKM
jgi:hypothetical protein